MNDECKTKKQLVKEFRLINKSQKIKRQCVQCKKMFLAETKYYRRCKYCRSHEPEFDYGVHIDVCVKFGRIEKWNGGKYSF